MIPRPISSPAAAARSTLGRMPAAITTRSASIVSSPARRTRSTRVAPSIASVIAEVRVWTRSARSAQDSSDAAGGSSCCSIRCVVRCTTVVRIPRSWSARAASRPSSPPPITMPRFASRASARIARALPRRATDARAQRPRPSHRRRFGDPGPRSRPARRVAIARPHLPRSRHGRHRPRRRDRGARTGTDRGRADPRPHGRRPRREPRAFARPRDLGRHARPRRHSRRGAPPKPRTPRRDRRRSRTAATGATAGTMAGSDLNPGRSQPLTPVR